MSNDVHEIIVICELEVNSTEINKCVALFYQYWNSRGDAKAKEVQEQLNPLYEIVVDVNKQALLEGLKLKQVEELRNKLVTAMKDWKKVLKVPRRPTVR
jgi:flagellin-specific chaperone FliS